MEMEEGRERKGKGREALGHTTPHHTTPVHEGRQVQEGAAPGRTRLVAPPRKPAGWLASRRASSGLRRVRVRVAPVRTDPCSGGGWRWDVATWWAGPVRVRVRVRVDGRTRERFERACVQVGLVVSADGSGRVHGSAPRTAAGRWSTAATAWRWWWWWREGVLRVFSNSKPVEEGRGVAC